MWWFKRGLSRSVKLYGVSGLLALLLASGLAAGAGQPQQPAAGPALETYEHFYVADGGGWARFNSFWPLGEKIYASVLNSYAEALPEDVRLYALLAPTSAAFTLPEEYAGLFPDQHAIIKNVAAGLNERFRSVDIYPTLAAHRDEYLYFRTDHHWTQRAGYLAYLQLAGAMDIPAYTESAFTLRDSGVSFLGSIETETGSPRLAKAPDRLYYYEIPSQVEYVFWDNEAVPHTNSVGVYKPWYLTQPNKYAFFMGGDLPYIRLKTDAGTGRKLALIKDSYANTILPFLTMHYDEIHVIDPRNSSFNALQIIEENDIKEVLFVNYARVVSLPKFLTQLRELMERDYVVWR